MLGDVVEPLNPRRGAWGGGVLVLGLGHRRELIRGTGAGVRAQATVQVSRERSGHGPGVAREQQRAERLIAGGHRGAGLASATVDRTSDVTEDADRRWAGGVAGQLRERERE